MRSERLLASALWLAAATACDQQRERPLPQEVSGDVQLEVEVLSPVTNDVLLVGDTVEVRVRAAEQAGRLRGIGFVARRSGPEAVPVDSAFEQLPAPAADTTLSFPLRLPTALTSFIQLDIYGLASGPGGQRVESQPQHVLVLPCPPNAIWC